MRKLLLAVLGLALVPAHLFAQDRGTIVELPADWKAGERHRIELIKEREQYRDTDRTLTGRSRTLVDAEVLRKSENGFVIRWTYGKTRIPEGAGRPSPLTEKMVNLSENMRLEFRTDALGSVESLQNVDEVVSHYRVATRALFQWMTDKGFPDAASARLRQSVGPLTDPAIVELLALRGPSLFHAASGGRFQLGTRQEYEDRLPNPWGGKPFPSKAYFLLREVKPQENRAVIEWKQNIDPEKGASVLLETLTALAKRANRPVPKEEDLSSVTIKDSARFVFDTKTGWPVSVTHERTTSMGGIRRIDRMMFRMLAD